MARFWPKKEDSEMDRRLTAGSIAMRDSALEMEMATPVTAAVPLGDSQFVTNFIGNEPIPEMSESGFESASTKYSGARPSINQDSGSDAGESSFARSSNRNLSRSLSRSTGTAQASTKLAEMSAQYLRQAKDKIKCITPQLRKGSSI